MQCRGSVVALLPVEKQTNFLEGSQVEPGTNQH